MGFVEAVQQQALDPLTGRAGEFGRQPLARRFLQLVERFQAERLGKLVIDDGFLRRFDQGRRCLELGRLASQFRVAVIRREGDFQGAGFARGDADQLLLEAGNERVGTDRHLNIFGRATIERRAIEGALEGDRDAVPGFGLGALALCGEAAVLLGDALDGIVDLGVRHLCDRLLDREALEIGELNRGHNLDRNGIGEIGLSGEDVIDFLLLRRHRDLGFGRQSEAALREELRVGVADGLVDGLRHHRTAVHLLEVAHGHLARTKAVDADLVLEIDQTGVRLGIEIGGRNADLEFVLQSVGDGFLHLHGVNLLPLSSGQNAGHLQFDDAGL
ncbi:hypothetical protein GALL_485780 [mine drainage metagenome]|uniref:NAD-specific glutamate dehydrogenase n=1 Tax=mine drainage metagenome TaxID=410659 RepID=A0A1J5PDV4_9ZZZZ